MQQVCFVKAVIFHAALSWSVICGAPYQLLLPVHLHIGNHITMLKASLPGIPQITIIRNIYCLRTCLYAEILIAVKVQIRHNYFAVRRLGE